jgi:multicomponent Na+:H+ antiporter subunit E
MKIARTAVPLFAFWLALTGSLEPSELIIGAVLSVALGAWATRFLWTEDAPTLTPGQTLRFLGYLLYLLRSIIVAAIGVAEVVLDPQMPIEPVLVTHRTSFKRVVSRIAFANSITLTPGTLTVDVDGNSFLIHCIDERFADDISSGELERRVARVFEE